MKNVELFENDRAKNYENFVDTWIPNYRYFISIIPKLLKNIDDKNVLVVGCGTGNEILAFKDKLYEWEITGIDPSIEMIAQAKERLKNYPNIKLINGTVNELPTTTLFASATLLLVLHFLPDDGSKLNLLKDIQKRLQPNAPFIMLDITGSKDELKNNIKVLKYLLPDTISEEEKEIRKNRILNKLQPVSKSRLSELLIEAGFITPINFFQSTIYNGWLSYKKI